SMLLRPPRSPLFPYTTLFRSEGVHPHTVVDDLGRRRVHADHVLPAPPDIAMRRLDLPGVAVQAQERGWIRLAGDRIAHGVGQAQDRKSTRLNSSHVKISYAVF